MGVFRVRSMEATPDPARSSINQARAYVTLVRLAAAVAFCLAILILLGWALDLSLLRSGLPGERATQPLSAVCFALCGISLMLLAALLSYARRINSLETIRHSVATDLRTAETRLARAAYEKEKQLATLAHELRNPLTPLRNGVEIVRQMSGGNPVLARTADVMARQIARLVRLVDDRFEGTPTLPETAAAQPSGTIAASAESCRLKILVADDNADGADSLAMLLQAQGHIVLTAPDGRRAVDLAEVFRPDVILMDLAMPHLDGLQATRELRLRPWGASVRIIAVTAWGHESERRRTLEAGMDFHLVKPVEPEALAALLRQRRD